jgi:hypothetical protein
LKTEFLTRRLRFDTTHHYTKQNQLLVVASRLNGVLGNNTS